MNLEEATLKALNGELTEDVNQNVLTKLNTELKKLNGKRVYLDELKSDVEKTLASVLGKEVLSQVEWYKFEPEDKYEFSGFLEIDGIEDDVEVMVEILDHKSYVELRVGGDELNEAKKITEDKETERYRPVALLDGENSYKIDRIIMLNNKHTSDELQAAIGKAKEDRAEEIREYGDDWEYITEELDKNGFDWYEIAVNGIEEVYY